MNSLFVSVSFVTPLDYSVVNVGVVDHQPAVMMLIESKTVHSDVTPGLDFFIEAIWNTSGDSAHQMGRDFHTSVMEITYQTVLTSLKVPTGL